MALPPAAAEFYRGQAKLTVQALAAARKIWGTRAPADFDAWFDRHVAELVQLVIEAQASTVVVSEGYVGKVLAEQGTPVLPDMVSNPALLVGIASDGRPLDSLMYGAVIRAKATVAKAPTPDTPAYTFAWSKGLEALQIRVQTQIADASRVSTGLSTITRHRVDYVRMLNAPSCSRCVVLAGRHYKSSHAFDRHPGCDCRHVPCREDAAGDLRTDPAAYFASLSPAEQDKAFTTAGAQAIRDGADINQVVNVRRGAAGLTPAGARLTEAEARAIRGDRDRGRLQRQSVYGQEVFTSTEGVTRRGLAYKAMKQAGYAKGSDTRTGRYFSAKAPRLMPESILELAEDRADALRLLKLYGYLL